MVNFGIKNTRFSGILITTAKVKIKTENVVVNFIFKLMYNYDKVIKSLGRYPSDEADLKNCFLPHLGGY